MIIKTTIGDQDPIQRRYSLGARRMIEMDEAPFFLWRAGLKKAIKEDLSHLTYSLKTRSKFATSNTATLFIIKNTRRVVKIKIGCQVFTGDEARKLYRWATRQA